MKKFIKILIINYFISIVEVFLFTAAIWARTGEWVWDGIIFSVFVMTQTIFLTVKYWVSIGKIEIKDG